MHALDAKLGNAAVTFSQVLFLFISLQILSDLFHFVRYLGNHLFVKKLMYVDINKATGQ